jgi:hypothetical protein
MHDMLIATLFIALMVVPGWLAMGGSEDKKNW